MDISKEKEVFDQYFKEKYPELYKDVFNEDGDDRAIIGYSFAWSAWQEVKAQADKKVKLLLCDEHLKKCESPTGIFNSQYPDEEPCLICLAKEAKAQAIPDGFVLVSKEIPDSVVERLRYSSYHWGDGMRDYFTPVYQMMIEAQEPTND